MSDFDFLYEDAPPIEVDLPPEKKRRRPGPGKDTFLQIPWQTLGQDGKSIKKRNKAQKFSHSTGLKRKPEWTRMTWKRGRTALYSGERKLGQVVRVQTEEGVKLYQWEVMDSGERGEYIDLRAARRAVEKRTLVGPWVELYNPYGALGKR